MAVDEQNVAANAAVGETALQPAIDANLRVAYDVDPPVGALGNRHLDGVTLAHLKSRISAERIAVAKRLSIDNSLITLGRHDGSGLPSTRQRCDDSLRPHHRPGGAQCNGCSQCQRPHTHHQTTTSNAGDRGWGSGMNGGEFHGVESW